jgi:hypothetical protein
MKHTDKMSPHDCCAPDAHQASQRGNISWPAAAHATLHCLTGCVIGEFLGLAIGVSFGIAAYPMMGLSTVLAYISGFSLAIFPLMRSTGLMFKAAFKAIWLGEVISIGVMELVMNGVDYHLGGVRSGSLGNPLFWEALAAAVPAGYIAALPVNAWLIGRQLKKCH